MNVRCDARDDCTDGTPAYIDDRGFAYCADHGPLMRDPMYRRMRKLRPHEVRKLQRGETIARY